MLHLFFLGLTLDSPLSVLLVHSLRSLPDFWNGAALPRISDIRANCINLERLTKPYEQGVDRNGSGLVVD